MPHALPSSNAYKIYEGALLTIAAATIAAAAVPPSPPSAGAPPGGAASAGVSGVSGGTVGAGALTPGPPTAHHRTGARCADALQPATTETSQNVKTSASGLSRTATPGARAPLLEARGTPVSGAAVTRFALASPLAPDEVSKEKLLYPQNCT